MKLKWNKDDLHLHISRLLDQLVNVAQEDDLITEEENDIIESCRSRLWKGHDQFLPLLDQEIEPEVLEAKFSEIFENALSEATETAKKDGKISADELKIIDTMSKLIRADDFTKLIK